MIIDPESWPLLSRLVDQYLDLPPDSRAEWLATLDPEHASVLPALRQLLANEAGIDAEGFLNTLPDLAGPNPPGAGTTDGASFSSMLATGSLVGPYRLIRELGHGGMGVVWLAERADGAIKRLVALKLPIVSIHNTALADRFVRERDILSQLSHPGIARLYDAGFTDKGQPFLALEYVEGETITLYSDRRKLGLKARLQLFLQVLRAVQYAHANLIVHRDLKPANILVENAGEVRLLDFGIAKMLTEGEANETELTRLGGRALTPDYASPEQIGGKTITTASDVYSLGVVLYELLTGGKPYRLKRDTRSSLEDAILGAEPARPSQSAADETKAQARGVSQKKLIRSLKGDLDTIILKALSKQPAQRYASADAFAQDIERYLRGDAVLARPESAWYRVRKFVLRNTVAVGSAVVVLCSLSVGLGMALWEARIARTESQTAQAVQSFLTDIFRANSIDQPDPARGRQTTAAELLDIGAKKIDGILNEAPGAKLRVLEVLGQMYDELELNEQAASIDRKRAQLARQLHGNNDPSVAQALARLAKELRTSPAAEERERALAEAKRILDYNRDFTSKTRARVLLELANGYTDKDLSKALELTDQAVQIDRAFPADRDAVSAIIQQGVFHALRGEAERAEECYQRALTALDAIRPTTNHDRSQIYTYLGQAQRELQKFDAADKSQRLAFRVAQAVGGADHQLTLIAQMDLGWFLADTSRTAEGLRLMADAKDRIVRTRGADPQTVPWALNRYGRGLLQVGRLEEANDVLAQAAEILRKYRPGSGYLATVLDLQAAGLTDVGHYREAQALLDEAARIHTSVHDEPIYVNENLAARSGLLLASGRPAEAAHALDGFFMKDSAPGAISLTWARGSLARAEADLGAQRYAQAAELASRVRVAVERSPSRTYFKYFEAQAALVEGKGLLLMGRASEALPLLERAVQLGLDVFDTARSPTLANAQVALAKCLLALGSRDQARVFLSRARTIQAAHKELGDHLRQPLRELETLLAKRN